MNRLKLFTVLTLTVTSLLFATSCSSVKGIFGKAATAEQQSAQKITLAQDEIYQNKGDQMSQVSQFSYGTGYALNKVTNKEPAVVAANELNTRTLNIAGLPNLANQETMSTLVDELLDPTLVAKAKFTLSQKDQEINNLQSQAIELQANKQKAINDYITLANATALKVDTLSSTLASYTSYWGLGGVALGLWSFAKHILWVLIGCTILYIALRLLADTNPVAAAVFSIFTRIGSLAIQLVEYIAPKSIQELELVSSEAYTSLENEYNTLKNSIITAAVTPVAKTATTPTITVAAPSTGSLATSGST
jgi:hypothetical protein